MALCDSRRRLFVKERVLLCDRIDMGSTMEEHRECQLTKRFRD